MTHYISSKITLFYTLLIVMVVYIHSTYLEMYQYETADFVWKFWGGYGLCSVANPLFFIISGYLLVGGNNCSWLVEKIEKKSQDSDSSFHTMERNICIMVCGA